MCGASRHCLELSFVNSELGEPVGGVPDVTYRSSHMLGKNVAALSPVETKPLSGVEGDRGLTIRERECDRSLLAEFHFLSRDLASPRVQDNL